MYIYKFHFNFLPREYVTAYYFLKVIWKGSYFVNKNNILDTD